MAFISGGNSGYALNSVGFVLAVVLIVYIGRTLALIKEDEQWAAEERAKEGSPEDDIMDEEVGLMGGSLE